MVVCVCQIRFRRAVGGAVTRLWILAVPHGSCAGAGHLLGRVVKNLKNKVKLRGWPFKIPEDQLRGWQKRVALEVLGVFAFLAACHFLKAETRSLFNFFLSSFVCPMLRHWSCPSRTVTASRAYATNYNHPHRTASSFRTCLLYLHSCRFANSPAQTLSGGGWTQAAEPQQGPPLERIAALGDDVGQYLGARPHDRRALCLVGLPRFSRQPEPATSRARSPVTHHACTHS
jgi:hypothetical protein